MVLVAPAVLVQKDRHLDGRGDARHGHVDGFFPKSLDEREVDASGWIFCRAGDTYVAVRPLKPYEWIEEDVAWRLRSHERRNGFVVLDDSEVSLLNRSGGSLSVVSDDTFDLVAPPLQQAAQLAAHLQGQGMGAEEAAALLKTMKPAWRVAIVAVLGPGLINALYAIAVVNIPFFARNIRGVTLSLARREFPGSNSLVYW